MENFPFHNNQEDFYDFDSESDESTEEENPKKKKKNVVSELWSKLFAKEAEQPKEEQKGFFEAFQALFRKTAGVEKEEIEQTEDDSKRDGFRFPFASSVEIESAQSELAAKTTENAEDLTVTEQLDSYELQEEPRNTLIGEGIEQSDTFNGVVQDYDISDAVVDINDDNQINRDEISDNQNDQQRALDDMQSVNRELFEQQNTISSPVEEQVFQDRSEPVIKERETIVEHRKKTGATLVGAIIADKAIKSREHNAQSDTEYIKGKLDNINKTNEQNTAEIERLRVENKLQAEQLRTKRKTATEHSSSMPKAKVPENSTVIQNKELQQPNVSQIDPDILPPIEEIKSPSPTNSESLLGEKVKKETSYYKKPNILSPKEVEQSVFSAPEKQQNIGLQELILDERKHEIKNIPMTKAHQTEIENVDYKETQHNLLNTNKKLELQVQHTNQKRRNRSLKPEYKNAVKQGVSAGIIILVSLGVIILIWSLFN